MLILDLQLGSSEYIRECLEEPNGCESHPRGMPDYAGGMPDCQFAAAPNSGFVNLGYWISFGIARNSLEQIGIAWNMPPGVQPPLSDKLWNSLE